MMSLAIQLGIRLPSLDISLERSNSLPPVLLPPRTVSARLRRRCARPASEPARDGGGGVCGRMGGSVWPPAPPSSTLPTFPVSFATLVVFKRAVVVARPRRQPPPVAHPPILGEEWVPLTLRMLNGLFLLAGTSPPTRNQPVKAAVG